MSVADKMIKVMAEYTTRGLWDGFDGPPLTDEEISELNLDMFVLNRLKKWTDWYEDNDDWSDESLGDFDYAAFATEGLAIAQAIKARLPEFTIWYFDENMCQAQINHMLPGSCVYQV